LTEFESGLTAILPRLRRFAHGLARNAPDADDLAQMTVERALTSRDQWQPGTRLDSWLYRIMRNLWIDTARARQRHARHLAPEEAGRDVGYDARPGVEARLELRDLMRAMARLPDEQREAVALVLIEGLGYQEAANVAGVPLGTLSSRLLRGRQALLAALSGGETGDDR
jgi:RNA polymerase sigma-70 factor (ECF subfamily)